MQLDKSRKAVLVAGLAGLTVLAAPASADELNVVMFSMPYTRALADMGADFEAATGHTVNMEVIGQDVFESRITLSFTGGSGDIDVVHTPVIQLQRWVAANWLRPVTTEIAAMDTREDILAGPLDSFLVNGEYWGLPFLAGVGMMAYRTDILSAAGYDDPPATWEELLEVAAAIDTPETAAIAMRVAPGQGFNMFVYPQIMRAHGGAFFADYPTDLTPNMNTPEGLEALNVYMTLMNDYGPDGIGNFNFGEVTAAMQNGQVAIIIDESGLIAQTLDPEASQMAANISIAAVPSGPAGRSPAIAVHGFGIPADAPNPEAAFAFMEWATSEAVQTQIAISAGFADFTRASVAANPDVTERFQSIHPDFLNIRVAMLNDAIGHYRPLIPQWPAIGAAVGENINAAVNGIVSPEEALVAADREIAEILAE